MFLQYYSLVFLAGWLLSDVVFKAGNGILTWLLIHMAIQ